MGNVIATLWVKNVKPERIKELREILTTFVAKYPEFQVKDFNYSERIGLPAEDQTILLLQDILKQLNKAKGEV